MKREGKTEIEISKILKDVEEWQNTIIYT
jgi:hypothetical protein